jgi:hypothetical protein
MRIFYVIADRVLVLIGPIFIIVTGAGMLDLIFLFFYLSAKIISSIG